jgi:cell division protein FtsI/penicillin-binding protein 2
MTKNNLSMNRRQFCFWLLANTLPSSAASSSAFYWKNLETGNILSAYSGQVPLGVPGSLIKLVSTALICQEKLFQPEQEFECTGTYKINGQTYNCQVPHGKVNLIKALGFSCNVFFAQAAQSIDPNLFIKYAKAFKLDRCMFKGTSFSFPKNLNDGPIQNYVLGLSPNLQPNAFQLIEVASCIAQQKIPTFSLQTWRILQEGMKLAGRYGTAKALDPLNKFKVAAKTGTSQHGNKFQSWIIGYFPYDKPKYSFCLRSFNGTSQSAAVPQAHYYLNSKKWY